MSALPNSKVSRRPGDYSVCKNCGSHKDGRCKECLKAYKRANADRILPQQRAQARRHRRAHPEKEWARTMTRQAIAAGRLIPGPCEVCGTADVQAHHDDYGQPLAVRWMCFAHHRAHHVAERRKETK